LWYASQEILLNFSRDQNSILDAEKGAMMSLSFPNESIDYRAARNRLLQQEIELRRMTEAVAQARRQLPPGGIVAQDYVFLQAGPNDTPTEVRMSELFGQGLDTLVIYNFMFPRSPDDERPCPSCTAMLDALDGAAQHIRRRVNFAVVAKAQVESLLAYAHQRGWRELRLLSEASNSYNHDYFGEDAKSAQRPMLNVFRREGEVIRHFWGSELLDAPTEPGQDPRHVDSIDPLWNLFDFTPEGRGTDWYPELSYC
jgi:predicted dithiol-disulfide oxidoreductase (DUF899 family)